MIEVLGITLTALIPLAGWVLAIQSKVSQHEVQLEGQKELILSKLDDIDRRLGRIERYLNGSLGD